MAPDGITLTDGEKLIADYLARVDRAARYLPRRRRDQVLAQIADRLVDEMDSSGAEAAGTGAIGRSASARASTEGLLAHMGDPKDLVRATDGHVRGGEAGPVEYAAVVLLLAGGIVWLIGWFVGLALLWASPRWSTSDKVLGSLIWPGGVAGVFVVFLSYYLAYKPDEAANVVSGLLHGGAPALSAVLISVLLVALPQVIVAVRLIRRARLPEQSDRVRG